MFSARQSTFLKDNPAIFKSLDEKVRKELGLVSEEAASL